MSDQLVGIPCHGSPAPWCKIWVQIPQSHKSMRWVKAMVIWMYGFWCRVLLWTFGHPPWGGQFCPVKSNPEMTDRSWEIFMVRLQQTVLQCLEAAVQLVVRGCNWPGSYLKSETRFTVRSLSWSAGLVLSSTLCSVWSVCSCGGLSGGGSVTSEVPETFFTLVWWTHAFTSSSFKAVCITRITSCGPFHFSMSGWSPQDCSKAKSLGWKGYRGKSAGIGWCSLKYLRHNFSWEVLWGSLVKHHHSPCFSRWDPETDVVFVEFQGCHEFAKQITPQQQAGGHISIQEWVVCFSPTWHSAGLRKVACYPLP